MASWGYFAVKAHRAQELEREVARLSGQDAQVAALAQELDAVESAYEGLRALFGTSAPAEAGDLWLPPSAGRAGTGAVRNVSSEAGAPTEWPLTEPGFLTRTPMEGGGEEHPGIDIAVPTGSYVRAAGSGTVVETGADGVYGNYVVVDHGDGYRSLYGHASLVLAAVGEEVRRDEVIALSGSSGQSTAPHLHFEITKDDLLVDPLTLVAQP
jgi:murein DD-endopeptidase MepM/ murein hydrolase activator NlpD